MKAHMQDEARATALKEQMLAAARQDGCAAAGFQAAFAEWAQLRQGMVADPSCDFTAEAHADEADMLATAVGEQAAARLSERVADQFGTDAAAAFFIGTGPAGLDSDELHVRATALRLVRGETPAAN